MDVQERNPPLPHYLRWVCVTLYSLFIFFSAVYIYPLARWAQAQGYGWLGALFAQIAITLMSVFLVFQAVRSLRRGRLVNVLIMVVIGASFILAFHLVQLPIEQFHFLQYGIVGMLIFWALSGRPYTLQFYLFALNVILIISELDEIIQGFVPNRFYDLEDVFVDILSGTMGLLLLRVMDLAAPPPLHPASRAKHGVSTGPLPMIDLHIFWTDLLYLVPIIAIVFLDQYLVNAIRQKDIVGHWSCVGSYPCDLSLGSDGKALLTINQSACAVSYNLEGDLLDGFRIRIEQPVDEEETPQACKIPSHRVFDIQRSTGNLYLRHDDLGILTRNARGKGKSPESSSHG